MAAKQGGARGEVSGVKGRDHVQEKSGSFEHQAGRCTGSGDSGAAGMDSDHIMEDQVRQRGLDLLLRTTESHRSLT